MLHPPPFPTALHTTWSTRYPTSLYATPLPPSPQHCTPGVLHGTPSAFMEHPSPIPHSTAHRVYYTVPHQPLWNTPPPFPIALRTGCTTRYPISLYATPPPLPHSTAHHVVYTVPHQPLWNTPPPFPTALHTGCTTRYSISLYGTPLPPSPQHRTPGVLHGTPPAFMEHRSPPSPQHCTPGVLHGTPPAFMEHPSPLPHSTAHLVDYTVAHHPLWNTPPPFPTSQHTGCTTRYPTSLYETPLPPYPQHCRPGGLHGTPPTFMEHPSPPPPQNYTPRVLHGTPPAFMEHPSPLPHSTAHLVYYTVPHHPLWNTPPPFPTSQHTGCTTRYPTSLYETPLPPYPQHCRPGGLHGTPPAFMEHPSPPSPQHCTPGGLHGTPPAFMEHPPPLPHSTAHQVVYTVPHQPLWNTPPIFSAALHTTCTTRHPNSLYGTPLPPSPQHCTPAGLHGTPPALMQHPSPLTHSTAHPVVYMVPHQPLWNTPPPFPTALHTGCTTRYPTSLYGTALPPSPQHCTLRVLPGIPPPFMQHPSPLPHSTAHRVYYTVPHQPLWNTPPPLPHSTAHRVYYTVPHQPLWNTPPPFPTEPHTKCPTRYPTSLYGTPIPPSPQNYTPRVLHGTPPVFMEHPSPPSPQHCTPGGLHGTPPAFMEHPSPLPHSTAHRVVYTVPHQPLWNTPPHFPTALHTRWSTWYPTSLYGTPLPPSP